MEPLFVSVQQGDLRLFIELLSRHPNGVNAIDENGQTVVHYACALGQCVILNHLLSLSNCQIFLQDHIYGYTALHIACLFDQQRVVVELLRRVEGGTNPIDMQDRFGWTALHHAARNGNIEMCKKLITNAARPDIRNSLLKAPCHYAAEHGHLSVLKYIFDYVEKQLTPPVVTEAVLVEPTLLHCAALNNHVKIIEWLRHRSYPAACKYQRTIDFNDDKSHNELPEEVAAARGHLAVRGILSSYRRAYEKWVQDICEDKVTLDRIKFCICGHPRVGKSAMRQSLSKPYLQQLLGRDVAETEEDDLNRCTFGIEVTSLQLSGKDLFSVWDFAGQIESFITHHFFISTQSTVFAVLVDLTSSLDDQKSQLMRWLGFIKVRNLGQVPFIQGPRDFEKDIVPMPSRKKNVPRQLPVRPWTQRSFRRTTHSEEDSLPQETMFGTVLQPVPVMIVGSHYDLVSVQNQQEAMANTQKLVTEMKERFEEYLDISPQLFPLNCLRAVSPEIKSLKDHLCEVRSTLLELQPQYPRVVELVARKIESLRVEHPTQKVLYWDEMRDLVREEVNGLVSERQLGFICKCLADAGVLVYFQDSALANYVFIDPGWLCQDVLGKALAPGSFPASRIASIGSAQISAEVLEEKFAEHIDQKHVPIIIKLLQQFDLCHRLKDSGLFEFPALLTESINPDISWVGNSEFVSYSGRKLVCADDTDSFPPGFFSRLQVQVSSILKQVELRLFKGSFVVAMDSYQSLVKINLYNTAIDLIGRTKEGFANNCSQLLDQIQGIISKLIRDVCPTIFLELEILSSSDLKAHHTQPHCYNIGEVIAEESAGRQVVNTVTDCRESARDLLFFGDSSLQKANSGRNTKIAYIPEDVIYKIQDLLQDGEKDWRSLAKAINFGKYIQLLESKAPESTRLLLLKYGEKPRWTVHSLLYALKDINRLDAYNYVEARLVRSRVN